MKIFIDYEPNTSGKGKFLTRLRLAMEALDCKFVTTQAKADVALGVSRWRSKIKGIPKVLRIDGVHVNKTAGNMYKNGQIRKSIKKSDAVIFQSRFAQRMVTGILDVLPRIQRVIFNGAPVCNQGFAGKNYFDIVMVGNWGNRVTKRLHEMLLVADILWKRKYCKCIRFHVFGDAEEYMLAEEEQRNVYWHGRKNSIYGYLEVMNMMLNLQWFDWCPNSVIEAMCCGLPVMCGNGCGVEEIVGTNGWVLPINKPIKAKMFGYKKAPEIDLCMVADKIIKVSSEPHKQVDCSHVDINNIAKQYKNIFKDVLNVW